MRRDNGLSYRDTGAAEIISTGPLVRPRLPNTGRESYQWCLLRSYKNRANLPASTSAWFALQVNAIGIYNSPPRSDLKGFAGN
jgi:hypothetical protein